MILRVLLISVILLLLAPAARAQCAAVLDAASDIPHHLVTPGNTGISYNYDLERGEYRVTVRGNRGEAGPYGPFHLSAGCTPATLRWENESFVLLTGGCGTFCWYVEVLPIEPGGGSRRIERPLAFDSSRNLIAYYHDLDTIGIRSLATGYEQEFATELGCDSASGLCFENVRFSGDSIEYTWRETEPARTFSMRLDDALLNAR